MPSGETHLSAFFGDPQFHSVESETPFPLTQSQIAATTFKSHFPSLQSSKFHQHLFQAGFFSRAGGCQGSGQLQGHYQSSKCSVTFWMANSSQPRALFDHRFCFHVFPPHYQDSDHLAPQQSLLPTCCCKRQVQYLKATAKNTPDLHSLLWRPNESSNRAPATDTISTE